MVEQIAKSKLKQTEIGAIPTDWDIKELGEIGIFSKGKGIRKDDVVPNGLPCVRYGEIYTHYNDYIRSFVSFISPVTAQNSKRLRKGDLLFTGSGETSEDIGKCVAFLGDEEAYAGGDIIILSPTVQNSMFLGYLLNHSSVVKQKAAMSQGEVIVHIQARNLAQVKIGLPQRDEQIAIANVLSDVDRLLEGLDELITKKKNIKQGVMQVLFVPKKRLPGFRDKWKTWVLREIAELGKGEQLNRSELTAAGEYPAWNGGIHPSGYTSKWNTEANTITISEGGNSCGFVNYCRERFWRGGHCYSLRIINPSISKLFLYHLLKFNEKTIMSLRKGSGLPNIQKESLREFPLNLPSEPEEQKSIARVLSDLDAEINQLEEEMDKYQLIRRGMMQQLLTGKVRLK